jgi:hypothetical protein
MIYDKTEITNNLNNMKKGNVELPFLLYLRNFNAFMISRYRSISLILR